MIKVNIINLTENMIPQFLEILSNYSEVCLFFSDAARNYTASDRTLKYVTGKIIYLIFLLIEQSFQVKTIEHFFNTITAGYCYSLYFFLYDKNTRLRHFSNSCYYWKFHIYKFLEYHTLDVSSWEIMSCVYSILYVLWVLFGPFCMLHKCICTSIIITLNISPYACNYYR